MIIGKLNKRITLQKPPETEDGYGGIIGEYTTVKTVWAELVKTNYSKQQAAGAQMSREQLQFKIRPNIAIKNGWKVIWHGDEYLVEAADNDYSDRTILIVSALKAGH